MLVHAADAAKVDGRERSHPPRGFYRESWRPSESRGVLFAGDAMRNFDYPSGKSGLGLHRFNEDRAGAYASLDQIVTLDLPLVLFGHGDPWPEGVARAVEIVRADA